MTYVPSSLVITLFILIVNLGVSSVGSTMSTREFATCRVEERRVKKGGGGGGGGVKKGGGG